MSARPSSHLIELTPQQTEVLARLACGQDTSRIAREMRLTVYTVRSYTRDVFVRLGADNAAHAVALGIGLELLPADVATNHTSQGESRVR